MVAPWQILAEIVQRQQEGTREWKQELLWAAPAISGFLLLMALVLAWVKQWRRRHSQAGLSSSDQLAEFRTLYERGELSPEEFARLRGLLVGRMKKELEAPTENPPDPPPSPARPPEGADQVPMAEADEEPPPASPAP